MPATADQREGGGVVVDRRISPAEAAFRLNVSDSTIRRMIAAKTIRSNKIGRLVRIPESEIGRLLAAVN